MSKQTTVAHGICKDINLIMAWLIEEGIVVDQNPAFSKRNGVEWDITFRNAEFVAASLKNAPYADVYEQLLQHRCFTFKFFDGALVQMMYKVGRKGLDRHRLTLFPPTTNLEFPDTTSQYWGTEDQLGVIDANAVPFPIRFDYERFDDRHVILDHPKSHLTLGQYKNCRIPVSAPISPRWFVDFVMRNFYHREFKRMANKMPSCASVFEESIVRSEVGIVHMRVPGL